MPKVQLEGDPLSGGDSSGKETHTVTVNGVPFATINQLSSGQNGFNPSPTLMGSSLVRINNVPIVLAGSVYLIHFSGPVGQVEVAVGTSFPVSASN